MRPAPVEGDPFAASAARLKHPIQRVSPQLYLVAAEWLTPERFRFAARGEYVRDQRAWAHVVDPASLDWARPLGLLLWDRVLEVGTRIYDADGRRLPTITLDREFDIRLVREGKSAVIRYRVVDTLPAP